MASCPAESGHTVPKTSHPGGTWKAEWVTVMEGPREASMAQATDPCRAARSPEQPQDLAFELPWPGQTPGGPSGLHTHTHVNTPLPPESVTLEFAHKAVSSVTGELAAGQGLQVRACESPGLCAGHGFALTLSGVCYFMILLTRALYDPL